MAPKDPESPFTREYLDLIRARDPVTCDHFYKHFDRVFRIMIRHSVAYPRIDDLVQDVFFKAFKNIDAAKPDDPRKLPGYLATICRRAIIDEWYPDDKEDPTGNPDAFPSNLEPIDIRLLRKCQEQEVRYVLDLLRPRYRDVIYRLYFLEQDRDSAAREMDTTPNQLKVLLCRAVQRFAQEWDKLHRKGKSPD